MTPSAPHRAAPAPPSPASAPLPARLRRAWSDKTNYWADDDVRRVVRCVLAGADGGVDTVRSVHEKAAEILRLAPDELSRAWVRREVDALQQQKDEGGGEEGTGGQACCF